MNDAILDPEVCMGMQIERLKLKTLSEARQHVYSFNGDPKFPPGIALRACQSGTALRACLFLCTVFLGRVGSEKFAKKAR